MAPTGEYDKLELEVDTVAAMVDGQDVDIFVPSGKIKIVGGFVVESDATATFEFNVRLVKRGNQDVWVRTRTTARMGEMITTTARAPPTRHTSKWPWER